MKDGYTMEKAIDKVGDDFADVIENEKEENRIIWGFAYTNHARSYLNYAQQIAELETRAKVMRLERDVAKYKWESDWWTSVYNDDGTLKAESDPNKTLLGNAVEGLEYGFDELEEFFGPTYKKDENDDWTY